jgi:hypothetical protein
VITAKVPLEHVLGVAAAGAGAKVSSLEPTFPCDYDGESAEGHQAR